MASTLSFSKTIFSAIILFLLNVSARSDICTSDGPTATETDAIFQGARLNWGSKAGVFLPFQPDKNTWTECVLECCKQTSCNAAFLESKENASSCVLVQCVSDDSCRPVYDDEARKKQSLLVHVRSIDESSKPLDDVRTCDPNDPTSCLANEVCVERGHVNKRSSRRKTFYCKCKDHYISDADTGVCREWLSTGTACAIALVGQCEIAGQVCVGRSTRSRDGRCQCEIGQHLASSGKLCVADGATGEPGTEEHRNDKDDVRKLTVSAGDARTLVLPDNALTLTAFVLDSDVDKDSLTYRWHMIASPEKYSGSMGGRTTKALSLTELVAGDYQFRVDVLGTKAAGEATVSVTVLPAPHKAEPPVAKITPAQQTVKLPNAVVILDGQDNTDGGKIAKYQWSLDSGPAGSDLNVDKTTNPLLKLHPTVPGTYKFRLTVTDSAGQKNEATATVEVQPEDDSPPRAIAGPNQVVELPRDEIVLNGNQSWDDHAIVRWQWTRLPPTEPPVDVEGSMTPYLRLTKLQVGEYSFSLQVFDAADHEDKAEVRLIVRAKGSLLPVAEAGVDQTITWPQDTTSLDGTGSSNPDGAQWQQVSGPSTAVIVSPSLLTTPVTGLRPGTYRFRLTMTGNVSDDVAVVVQANFGAGSTPVANAGPDKVLRAPDSVAVLDGSQSRDDGRIVRWSWSREESSGALGHYLNGSEHESVLRVAGLEPGRYVFVLEVEDEQGLRNTDSAIVMVYDDEATASLLEMILNLEPVHFTEKRRFALQKQMELLLEASELFPGSAAVVMRSIRARDLERGVVVDFYASDKKRGTMLDAAKVQKVLHSRLRGNVDFQVARIETVACYNNCSNHGTCDSYTKRCVCDVFWMENLLRAHFGERVSNCDWSILYVILTVFCSAMILCGFFWAMVALGRRCKKRRPRRRKHDYTLLSQDGEETKESYQSLIRGSPGKTPAPYTSSHSDEDIVFETSPRRAAAAVVANGDINQNAKRT